MIDPKQNFLDRIEQAFSLYKNSFINVSLLYIGFLVVNGIILKVFGLLLSYLGLKMFNVENLNIDPSLYINITYIVVIYIIFFVSLLIIQIPFYISLVLNIKQMYNNELITYKENFFIAMKSFKKIFYTYWYLFKYVWLIPCLLLIVGLIVLLFDITIGFIILVLTVIIFFYFILYRGTQVTFSLLSAIIYDDYSEENFSKSILITKNKLWRIFWNLVGLALILGLLLGVVNQVITLFLSPNDFSDLISSLINESRNPDFDFEKKIPEITEALTPTFSSIVNSLLYGIINQVLTGIIFIFTMIFSYLFFKRLEKENLLENNNNI